MTAKGEARAAVNLLGYEAGSGEAGMDHDALCSAQAAELLQMGYLGQEVAMYGTSVCRGGEIYYYITAREDKMRRFLRECYLRDAYPTPQKYYVKRYDGFYQDKEAASRAFRLEIARQLRGSYSAAYHAAIADLTRDPGDNQAYPLLREMAEDLRNGFDSSRLDLFADLLDMVLMGRHLTPEGHSLLRQWTEKEKEKICTEPVLSGTYRRTYAGFAYQKPDGSVRFYCDALPCMAREKQVLFVNRGYIVTPILTEAYYADSFKSLERSNEAFRDALRFYLDENYIRLMHLLKALPPGVDPERYLRCMEQLRRDGQKEEVLAFQYYGYLWNVLRPQGV